MTRIPSPSWVFAHPARCLAFGLGAGLAPRAPGTAGTLLALPFGVLLLALPPWLHAVIVLLAFAAGIGLCGRTARELGVHDHGGIVWDECVGLWLACWLLPAGWPWWLAAFVLFRAFDIVKPWPIGWLDRRVHGGLGIMLDDLVAGLLAWAVLQGAAAWLGVSALALPGWQA